MFSIHNIASTGQRVILFDSEEKCARIKHNLQVKTVKTRFKHVGGLWEDKSVWAFSLEKVLLCIMDWHFVQKWCPEVKDKMPQWGICFLQTGRFTLHKTFIYHLEHEDYLWIIVMFWMISCLDFHSDSTHSL